MNYRQCCHVGNTAQHCRLGLIQDSDFARAFVPISWMLKKHSSVSHSSPESEVVSLDAGLRMDGILALDFWDVVIELLHVVSNQPKARSNLLRNEHCEKNEPSFSLWLWDRHCSY